MYINLMTFNIKHGLDFRSLDKESINLNLILDTIKKCEGEIVGLNEVHGEGSDDDYTDQSRVIAEELGYHWYFAKAIDTIKGSYGNALISKYPIIKAKTYTIRNPLLKCEDVYYETRSILRAVVDIPTLSCGLNVFVTHFGLSYAEQRRGVAKIKKLIKNLKEGPCVFMGDLNMEPDNKILKPIYSILKDTSIAFNEPKFSFPSDKPKKRIDYIFVDKKFDVCTSDIPNIVVSDHRPVVSKIWIGQMR